jgi:hydrophobe/amphiphile efflux-1 (HAE1) family protein
MELTATVLRRPVAATVLAISVFVVGLFSLKQLDVDYLPEIIYPMIKIHIWWHGATPEEIDTNIADPVERVLATVDDLDYLESSSIEGMYTLLVNFRYGVNVEEAYQDVITAMGRVARQLPPDMEPPVIIKADPSQLPVMQVTVFSEQRDLVWLREWVDNWLQDQIITVPGTAGMEIVGGLKREIRVHLDPDRLRALGMTPARIAKALYEENRETFAGRITVENREIIARTMGEYESLEEIRNVVVARHGNALVYLKDVATVEDSHEEMRVNTRFNGRPCVKLNVLKQAEANTVTVARAVQERLAELRGQVPDDIEFGVVENQGDYVMSAIHGVRGSAIAAAILVIVVTFLFLGQWRQIVVMLVALPLTLVANFVVMHVAGFSLNVFSLGGLVVAMGVVLDNSIVAVENITRLKRDGEERYALRGLEQVGTPILAATLSFLALVLPFLMVPGLMTLLFKELVMAVAGVVVISLMVAWTITPLLTDRILRPLQAGSGGGFARWVEWFNDRLAEGYGWLLRPLLRHRWLVALVALIALAAGGGLARHTGSEFLPKIDDGRVMVKVKMPAGTAVGEVDRVLAGIERIIADDPAIESYFSLAGGKVWGLYTYEIAQEGQVDIQLVPKAQRAVTTDQFIAALRPRIAKAAVPGAKLPVMHMKIKGIRQVGEQQVEVEIKGPELEEVFPFAQQVAAELRAVEGLTGVNVSMSMTKPEYRVHVDRVRASALDIPVRQVAETLRSLVQGSVATQYRDGSEYYAIRVMVPETKMSSKRDLEQLVIEDRSGGQHYLRDIAEVRRAVGPVEIVRQDQAKQVIVRADAAGISVGEAVARAHAAVAALQRPAGVYFEMGGQARMMAEMKRTAVMVLGFAVFFAFVVLAVQFESVRLPLLILFCLPFCLIGMVCGLHVFGLAIGATVAIGVLIVVSAIANDGTLLLDLAETLRREQTLAPFEAILAAAKTRMRPRIMTTLSTIAGFVPLALNLGEGGDLLQPMAVAAIGGLTFELVVALFLMPCLYLIAVRQPSVKTKPAAG